MPDDIADLLLTGDSAIGDLQALVKQRLPTAKLRVLTLLAAAAYEAEDGSVGAEYVEKAFRAALKMAKGRGAKPN